MRYLSLALRAVLPSSGVAGAPTCKYHPSCSQYATDALRQYGPLRGSLKAGWRLLRCNPWSRGGVDPA
jgi:putative membrane protein insertion efficiency factor